MALVAAGSLLAPTFAAAGEGYDQHRPTWPGGPHYPAHYRGAGHYYYPKHGYYYRYDHYHHYHNGHGGDSDDAAWAIGGLVLGATLATVAASNREAAVSQEPQPMPPPQKRKVVTCYDEVAYDKAGDPYVARQCYETWR
jgi:hypothetical protein